MFSKVVLFFSVLSVAMAVPTTPASAPESFSVESASCGNGAKVSCCNGGSDTLLAISCTIPILGQCLSGNVAACCKTDQDGLINIGLDCLPITL
ncbi:[NU+] prion formation protein 1 [Venturia nashicola]|uniref:[NU+] prion formation protein 1 n=1 Tax=Venturia nashicola TaxID=86259 RepID=A0A4Z1PEH9_9PEZI|nr:[NU+] prion formation protein 1 [Venturia nashicola]TLD30246.1 [NU+] prion formation protein 1 [Venturia nashicola]